MAEGLCRGAKQLAVDSVDATSKDVESAGQGGQIRETSATTTGKQLAALGVGTAGI